MIAASIYIIHRFITVILLDISIFLNFYAVFEPRSELFSTL